MWRAGRYTSTSFHTIDDFLRRAFSGGLGLRTLISDWSEKERWGLTLDVLVGFLGAGLDLETAFSLSMLHEQ